MIIWIILFLYYYLLLLLIVWAVVRGWYCLPSDTSHSHLCWGWYRGSVSARPPAMIQILILLLSGQTEASCQPGCVTSPPASSLVRMAGGQPEDCVGVCSLLHSGVRKVGVLRGGNYNYTSCWCIQTQINHRWYYTPNPAGLTTRNWKLTSTTGWLIEMVD